MADDDNGDGLKWVLIGGGVVAALGLLAVLLLVVLLLLAPIIGTFVLGVGGSGGGAQTPAVSWDYEYDAGEVRITHAGGDRIEEASRIEVVVDGETRGTWADFAGSGPVAAGDEITVGGLDGGETVRIVWNGPEGDSAVLSEYEVPR